MGHVPTRGSCSISNRLGCTYPVYQHHHGSSANGGWDRYLLNACCLLNIYQNNLKNQDCKRNTEYKSMIATVQDTTFNAWQSLERWLLVSLRTFAFVHPLYLENNSVVMQGQEILPNTARIISAFWKCTPNDQIHLGHKYPNFPGFCAQFRIS